MPDPDPSVDGPDRPTADTDGPTDAELDALLDALALKDERRTGWQLRGVEDPESVAAHSWGVAYLCLLFAGRAGVDPHRALELAVLHDLAEAETGDLPTRVDPADRPVDADEKLAAEREAIADLLGPFDADRRDADPSTADLLDDWEAYEARDDPTARFVKDMDLVDMCLQALFYERAGRYDPDAENRQFDAFEDLDEFFATAEPRLRTGTGRALFEAIRARYERAKRERRTG